MTTPPILPLDASLTALIASAEASLPQATLAANDSSPDILTGPLFRRQSERTFDRSCTSLEALVASRGKGGGLGGIFGRCRDSLMRLILPAHGIDGINDDGGPGGRIDYYVANQGVISLAVVLSGLDLAIRERFEYVDRTLPPDDPQSTTQPKQARLSRHSRLLLDVQLMSAWIPGYEEGAGDELNGVLLKLDLHTRKRLKTLTAAVEDMIRHVGSGLPFIGLDPLARDVWKIGRELRDGLSLEETRLRGKPPAWPDEDLGVFAADRDVWEFQTAVHTLKLLAGGGPKNWELARFLEDVDLLASRAGRPEESLRGIRIDLSEEQRRQLVSATRTIMDVAIKLANPRGDQQIPAVPMSMGDLLMFYELVEEIDRFLASELGRFE